MFFACIAHPVDEARAVDAAVRYHWSHLDDTGYVGELAVRPFPGGSLFWDGGSQHADVFEDESSDVFLLRGGYQADADVWTATGVHSIEGSAAWGEFAVVKVAPEGNQSTIVAFSDPAGSWPVYIGARGPRSVVTNDALLAGVVLQRTRLSSQVSIEILGYGHALGAETTIEGVRRIFPGDRISLTTGLRGAAPAEVSHGDGYRYRARATTDEEHASETLRVLKSAVSDIPVLQRFDESTVQLSGGLDSRLTVAVLSEVFAARPATVTLDLSDDAEMRIAASVAEELGYPHRSVPLGEMSEAATRAGWLLTGGQVSVHAAAGNILSYESANATDGRPLVIVGAWPADCLIGSYVPVTPGMTSRFLRRPMMRDWARKRAPQWDEQGVLLTGVSSAGYLRTAQRKLQRRLIEASGASAAQSISYWAMFSRQPAFSYLSPAILTANVQAVTPLLARPYLERLLQLTPTEILAKNFYRRFIRSAFPALNGIAYAATGTPITSDVVTPQRLPRTRDELYALFPAFLQRQTRRFVAWRQRSARSGAEVTSSTESASSEVRFWADFLDKENVSGRIELDGATVDATAVKDLHIRSVALALAWTKSYLDGADRELSTEWVEAPE